VRHSKGRFYGIAHSARLRHRVYMAGWERLAEAYGQDSSVSGEGDGTKRGTDVSDCLEAFTKEETLRKSEAWYCSKCKKHMTATKKFDLWKVPDILIIHLKRFSYNSLWRDKISTMVDFPITGLDMSNFIVNDKEEKSPIYDLYAVSNHYGGLGGVIILLLLKILLMANGIT